MRAGAAGADLVFHAAAHLGEWGDREEFERINVGGTRNALETARAAGVRRFVHVGTEAGLLAGQPLVNVNEDAPLRPDSKALYSATKAMAEQVVRERERRRLRNRRRPAPAGVGRGRHDDPAGARVGGREEALLLDRRRRPPHVHHARRQRDPGLMLGAERGRPGGVYFVTDGEPVVFREFVTELLGTQGVTPPDRNTPAAGRTRRGRRLGAHLAAAAPPRQPAGHAPRLLALGAGVHDRHLPRPPRARLRAGALAGRGHGGAAARARRGRLAQRAP